MKRSIISANDVVPSIGLSYVAPAASGSQRCPCTTARAAAKAPAGSSATAGTSPRSRPTMPSNIPWVSTTWATTSRAVHSSHGEGDAHRSAGTASIVAAKSAARRW